MTDPIAFLSTTPRHALPNLFVGQAQKEFTVNEALARLDGLLHPVVSGEADDPPASPVNGECWLVGSAQTGDWAGHAGELACWQAGNWVFLPPQPGMQVFDMTEGAVRVFDGSWSTPASVSAPSGGLTQDSEARAAITALIAALVDAQILATS